MNRTERRKKRKKDMQRLIIAIFVLILILALAGMGAAMWISGYRPGNSGTNQQETIVDENIETNPATEEMMSTEMVTEEIPETETSVTVPETSQENMGLLSQAQEKVAQMTLEQKVAQMFIITPEALTHYSNVTAAGSATKESYLEYPVGGMIYMSKNLKGTQKTTTMLANMMSYSQEATGLPLFLSVDEEGGSVSRVASNSAFEVTDVGDMSAIGATGDAQNAYAAGTTIGGYLSALGFNVDFAPVADVWSNPENEVVKTRSFGSDSQLVADMVCAELNGLMENHIYGVVKHFPGHGATTQDSHEGYASSDATLAELQSNELVPFQQAINQGVSFVMVGHISLPNEIGDDTPSSLSYHMITEVLRQQMGYQGIVVTDAMDMDAITDNYASDEAAVQAVAAGADIILMPDKFENAYKGILKAVEDGTLTEERINESVTRIVAVKLAMEADTTVQTEAQ